MYQLQTRKTRQAFSFIALEYVHYVPNQHQIRMMQSVASGLAKGIFYNTDFYAHVVEEMSDVVNDELLAQNSQTMPTENGYFGTDIYCCRKSMEAAMKLNAARANIVKFNVKPGLKIKNIRVGGKKLSTMIVQSVNMKEGTFSFTGKRRGSPADYEGWIAVNSPSFIEAIKKMDLPIGVSVVKNKKTTTVSIDSTPGYQASLLPA